MYLPRVTLRGIAGFSLVEVMVAVTVLALFMYSLTQFMGDSVNKAGQINNNLLARRLLDEQISRVLAIRGAFPRVVGPNGESLTYVACFDLNGKAIKNKLGSLGFVGAQILKKNAEELSDVCPRTGIPNTVFEFHVRPEIPSQPLQRVQSLRIGFFVLKGPQKEQYVETVLDYPASI